MGEVDPAFVQDPQQRPKFSTIQAEGIPVIDLSPITNQTVSDPSAIEVLVKEIGSACKEWGFFQVTNHGVPLTQRQKIENASTMFFSQNLEEKRKVSKDENSTTGYHDTEHTKNVRDWKEVFDFLAKDPTFIPLTSDEHDDRVTQLTNPSPQHPPHFRVILEEYIQEMEKLCFKLLELIALSLGLEAKRFEEYFMKDQTSTIRLNHYPPCPYPHLALGVGRHKDPGALTILAQDEVGGLEVRRKADQEWIRVKPTPDAYIVNVGDIIQVWSNDAYESVEHRVVVNSQKERFSIPFFFFPAHETEVKPLEELINEQNPPKYRPYKWGKFLSHRKNSNFKKQNYLTSLEEINKNITSSTMGEVEHAFVQEAEHRPKSSVIVAEGIPLIDLSPINYQHEDTIPGSSIQGLVKEIGSACKEWGFFQVINHKVPLDKRERIEEAARKFFALSLEEKLKVRRDAVNVLGYFEAEHTKNVRDWKEIYDFNVQEPTFIPPSVEPDDQLIHFQWDNRWPRNPPEFKEACQEYAQEVEKLAYKLMELVALSLGLEPNKFRGFFTHNTSNIRLNHYPPCPYPHLALGLGRHKDTGVLTVLAQDDVAGLEVRRKSDGEWIRVKPIFNSFIINVGDMIQVWSNDAYESVEHRVIVNSEKDRFSIPFFLKPALYTDVKPLEELTDDRNPPIYRPVNWGKFRTARMRSNFAKSNLHRTIFQDNIIRHIGCVIDVRKNVICLHWYMNIYLSVRHMPKQEYLLYGVYNTRV
ncbi:putative 2-oxoglutarate-dependent dioxygenase ANS [Mucuna pruriens]|uniref:2-oxoglutarate-dependent dioxygenase ANS n=1 Tax=Mucuna pruriens TaxID=157652 RepID=A0A371E0H0_MUCPR|nr:putative 2-oxoglutarate-dependent dioxygenase ANS [Mucuna pruriens]